MVSLHIRMLMQKRTSGHTSRKQSDLLDREIKSIERPNNRWPFWAVWGGTRRHWHNNICTRWLPGPRTSRQTDNLAVRDYRVAPAVVGSSPSKPCNPFGGLTSYTAPIAVATPSVRPPSSRPLRRSNSWLLLLLEQFLLLGEFASQVTYFCRSCE